MDGAGQAKLQRNIEKLKQKLTDTSRLIGLYNDAKAQLQSHAQQLAALRADRAQLEEERAAQVEEASRLRRELGEAEERRRADVAKHLRRVQEVEASLKQRAAPSPT